MKWKLVPVEPTEAMVDHGQGYIDCDGKKAEVVFRSMCVKAPNPLDDAEFMEMVARTLATPNMTPEALERSWRIYMPDARGVIEAIEGGE